MKCLVTGSSGFIGSHLVERLRELGHEVTGVDRKPGHWTDEVDDCAEFYVQPKVEVVFHLAAATGLKRSWQELECFVRDNVNATYEMLDSCLAKPKPPRFVFASTSSVYGKDASGPEDSPLRPCSPYGVTKLAAEHFCSMFAETHGLPVAIVRLFSVYGPRQRPDMGIRRFINAALRNQPVEVYQPLDSRRSVTYVSDAVEALVAAGFSENVEPGDVFNAGGVMSWALGDLLKVIGSMTGHPNGLPMLPGKPRKGDQEQTVANCDKAYAKLNWFPKVSLADGLAKQIEWQKQQLEASK